MIREVNYQDRKEFNLLAPHPLQSWEWGEFRRKTGIEVIRLGNYVDNKLVETAQLTIHRLPFTQKTIGYLPKSGIPSTAMLEKFMEIGRQYNCIFIKLEPNVKKENSDFGFPLMPSPHPLFTQYTFQLDITKSEEDLLKNMHPKSRYNIRVAQKNGVSVTEEENDNAFQSYIDLLFATTKRQKFFAHTQKYHQLMWSTLHPEGMAHLLTAKVNNDGKEITLVTWIVFILNGILYYPYGASSDKLRNVMASNLMMWEVIRFGKKHGARLFDMWGALGPNPNPKDPWFGFHRFKEGYGAKLIEFAGSYDLVIDHNLYKTYNTLHAIRQLFLKVKSNFR